MTHPHYGYDLWEDGDPLPIKAPLDHVPTRIEDEERDLSWAGFLFVCFCAAAFYGVLCWLIVNKSNDAPAVDMSAVHWTSDVKGRD